jgi:hypothetical protein
MNRFDIQKLNEQYGLAVNHPLASNSYPVNVQGPSFCPKFGLPEDPVINHPIRPLESSEEDVSIQRKKILAIIEKMEKEAEKDSPQIQTIKLSVLAEIKDAINQEK